MTANIENIIVKFLTNTANSDELDILSVWLKIEENKSAFVNFVKDHYAINYSINEPNSELLIDTLLCRIREDKIKVLKLKKINLLKYAAIFIGLIGVTYFVSIVSYNQQQNKITISDSDIVLRLHNGNVKIISGETNEKILNEEGKVVGVHSGNQLNYVNTKIEKNELQYNELLVPYGRTFDIVLSDGTKVKLNAGSSIKYPIHFLSKGNREVTLKGEAFFKVAKDAKHPFIVNANEINIRVLGTEFNISAYPEDKINNTVLIEGLVSVYKSNTMYKPVTSTLLNPGFKAELHKNQKHISIEKVDTSIYTAWINGKLIIKNSSFSEIRKKLERKYNVAIINNNKTLESNTFSAVFDIETIEDVMEVLKRSYGIDYEIIENQIIIN